MMLYLLKPPGLLQQSQSLNKKTSKNDRMIIKTLPLKFAPEAAIIYINVKIKIKLMKTVNIDNIKYTYARNLQQKYID